MAAMTSRFNIRCVIQYYSDQWSTRNNIRCGYATFEIGTTQYGFYVVKPHVN